MRIAQIATLNTPVRREDSGSIEGMVWLLSRELTSLGHEVTVFATADSDVCGELVPTLPGAYGAAGSPDLWGLCEWISLCHAVEQSARFDVLHSHAYLWGLPLEPLAHAPMVHTTHVLPEKDETLLRSRMPNACVTALSRYQWSDFPGPPAPVIYHGVDDSQFTFRSQPDDYVCYLGRFTWGKGATLAIAAARALGVRLLLAGWPEDYYHEDVEPLVDGRSVEFVGPVSGSERDRLLGGARALLYPLQYPEPFGLVQVEAMMCGTPVAAIRIGAVPEIVDEGVTGYSVPSVDEFAQAILGAFALDRQRVRERAEVRFSARRMAQAYARLYEHQIATRRSSGHSIPAPAPA